MGLPPELSPDERSWRLDVSMRRTGCREYSGRNYFTLSGGERQRVSIARCLCQHAGLFLLDEPTTFLDRESRDTLVGILRSLAVDEMPSLILVTHDQNLVDALGWPEYSLEANHG
jgi:zinc transport system ATP-binding protein